MLWDLDPLNEAIPLSLQLMDLKEDLVQVQYANGVLIDVGWYPSFFEDGSFVVLLVLNQDWEHPLMREECGSVATLRTSLDSAVCFAEAAVK